MKPVFLHGNMPVHAVVIFTAPNGQQSRKVCYDSDELELAVNAWDKNKRIDIFMVDKHFDEKQFWKDVERIRHEMLLMEVSA